ncbi:MAG: glycosyltransferase family 4 protein [Gammaproteobacteria bacterium]|jgi:teichuronic acid biosynthesis glycosyltransferase TuaC
MKIFFLTKRHYMSRDLLKDRYGRFYELPATLADCGAEVLVSCLSYYNDHDSNDLRMNERGVAWRSFYAGRNLPLGIYSYYRSLCRSVAEVRPDVIIGASDSIHMIIAAKLADRFDLPWCADLYDNFESYGQMRMPGLKRAYRSAVGAADAVTVVSGPLRRYVAGTCNPSGRLEILENAVPEGMFLPMDKHLARRELGLPETGRLIGTAGSLYRKRGLADLYRAFRQLSERRDDVYLILAGRLDTPLTVPAHDRILYLGDLTYERTPLLYNALDVGVICNRNDPFGRYCFPQKLYEMAACQIPIIAAAVGASAELLRDYGECLYHPGDSADLQRAVTAQLDAGTCPDVYVPDWPGQGIRLLRLLCEVTGAGV